MTGTGFRSIVDCQLDPPWLEWLTRKDDQLQIFLTDDVSGMPADLWSSAGLRHAEHVLLQCGGAADPDGEVQMRFACYFGEVFVRSLHGLWTNDPFPYAAPRATIRFTYTDARIDVHDHVVLALYHRSGRRWHDLHTAMSARCAAWRESGRTNR